jgi:two-component system aerobic respiration control sensor histidine kinase ArcB
MNELRIGIVACASMHELIKECIASFEGSFKIYPLVPPCTFNLKIDLIRYYIDRSINENNVTILAYGICHPQMMKLLSEYTDRVVRLKGNNCYEMFLGKEKYAEYHKKRYWMLNKPFFTRFKKDLLAGYEPGTKNSKMLFNDVIEKMLYIRFENDQLDMNLVEDFASSLDLEYEVYSTDITNLRRLLKEAIDSAKINNQIKKEDIFPKYPDKSEIQTILENIREIIFKIDIHSRMFTFISPQVKSILGYNPDEFIDIMNDNILIPIYHEEDRPQVIATRYKYLITCLNEGIKEPYELEYRMLHKNGYFIWVNESLYANYDQEGTIESFIGKIIDITKRKNAELKLIESQKKYKSAYNRAEFFNDLISHDLNNILQVILSCTQVNEEFLTDPEKLDIVKGNMNTIRQNVMQGANLVKNVNTLSRLEMVDISLIKVNVYDVLKKCIAFIKRTYPNRNINVQMEAFKTELFIQANELLTDVFENILLNAVKYNVNPRVEITIKISQKQERGLSCLNMEFMDNGIGIKDSLKEKIFQRGYREDKGVQGMGLGLYLANKIIKFYGGKITINNRVEGDYTKGSNFIIFLPMAI